MGISLKESGGDDIGEVSEINVTPFIDVVLVLLIIFMVAAPLSTVDVPVDLPVSNAAPQQRPDEPLFLTVTANLGLVLGEEATPREALQAALDTRTKGDREARIFLRADGAVSYEELMKVLNLLRSAGYLKVGLVGLEAATAGNATIEANPASTTSVPPLVPGAASPTTP